jgi:hypothetical protein
MVARAAVRCNFKMQPHVLPGASWKPRRVKGTTTPSLGAPPLLNQEGCWRGNSPPQMRRGGAPSDGVVLNG